MTTTLKNKLKHATQASALLFALTASLFSLNANAVEKIATINKAAIFQSLAQGSSIEANLAAEFKDRIDKVNKLKGDFEFNLEKQKRDGATMSDAQKQVLGQTLQTLGQEYQATAKALDTDMRKRQAEESNKLLVKIDTAINEFAKAGKYDLILMREAAAYVSGDIADVSEQVLKSINK